MGFSNDWEFLDDLVYEVVGDDFKVIDENGACHCLNAPIEWHYKTDEYGQRLDDSYPVIESLREKDRCIIAEWSKCIVEYRGKKYSIEKIVPVHDKHFDVHLRIERDGY